MTNKRGRIYKSKKAVMGIETLIIFIAMILVAGVASAVLIRTSGILQQKALAVSSQAVERVGTGMEVIQIVGEANTSAEHVYIFDIMLRLTSGSDDIQLKNVGLTYSTESLSLTSTLAHTDMTGMRTSTITNLSNATALTIHNLDTDEDDITNDTVQLVWNYSGTSEGLLFELSTAGTFTMNLGEDLDRGNGINIVNLPIKDPSDLTEDVFGYIHLNGTFNTLNNILNSSSDTQNFTFRIDEFPSKCKNELIRPEKDFCIKARLGNEDTSFTPGELLIFKFKVKGGNELSMDEKYEFTMIPKSGGITYVLGRSPDVYRSQKTAMWP